MAGENSKSSNLYLPSSTLSPSSHSENDNVEKIKIVIHDGSINDDTQRVSKKNMFFTIPLEPRYSQSSMIPVNIEDHEMPPPMTDHDHELTPEASKGNPYFLLYSKDDEKLKKPKKKVKPYDVVYHYQNDENQYDEDLQQSFDSDLDSEFDSELGNSENVRILDPSGGRPIEFTKEDYLRHIKQAVAQYMKSVQKESIVKSQKYHEDSQFRPSKLSVSSTVSPFKHSTPSYQAKPTSYQKITKNHFDKFKDASEDFHESPQVDLTVKKNKIKPFDLSAIDVGQTYQHIINFDHSSALKNVEEFDKSNALSNKPKFNFPHHFNNVGQSQKQKKLSFSEDNDNESDNSNLFKGLSLPKQYQQAKLVGSNPNQNQFNGFSSMNFDSSKLPRIVNQNQNNDDEDYENKGDDSIESPIQIVNGIPIANPYNIDLNTLK